MNSELYIYIDAQGEQIGPVPASVLKQMVQADLIARDALIWKNGFPTWIPYCHVFPDKPLPPNPTIPTIAAPAAQDPISTILPVPAPEAPDPIPPIPPIPAPVAPAHKLVIPTQARTAVKRKIKLLSVLANSQKEGEQETCPSCDNAGEKSAEPAPWLKYLPSKKNNGFYTMFVIFAVGLGSALKNSSHDHDSLIIGAIFFCALAEILILALLVYIAGAERGKKIFNKLLLLSVVSFVLDVLALFIPDKAAAIIGLVYLVGYVIFLNHLKYKGMQIMAVLGFGLVLGIIKIILGLC